MLEAVGLLLDRLLEANTAAGGMSVHFRWSLAEDNTLVLPVIALHQITPPFPTKQASASHPAEADDGASPECVEEACKLMSVCNFGKLNEEIGRLEQAKKWRGISNHQDVKMPTNFGSMQIRRQC